LTIATAAKAKTCTVDGQSRVALSEETARHIRAELIELDSLRVTVGAYRLLLERKESRESDLLLDLAEVSDSLSESNAKLKRAETRLAKWYRNPLLIGGLGIVIGIAAGVTGGIIVMR
jgi:hypothetical protein